MKFNRIRLSEESTRKLKTFKSATGLTPNVACRLALALSINEKNMPSLELYGADSGQEINRYTFLGEHEIVLLSLFKQWCMEANIKESEYYTYLLVHINRGVEILVNRVKGLDGLTSLIK